MKSEEIKHKERKFDLSTFVIVVIGLIIIIIAYYAVNNAKIPPDADTLNTTLILTFVGILATFVVVSNYIQVRDIKKELETQVNEAKDKIDTTISIVDTKLEENKKKITEIYNQYKAEIDNTIKNIDTRYVNIEQFYNEYREKSVNVNDIRNNTEFIWNNICMSYSQRFGKDNNVQYTIQKFDRINERETSIDILKSDNYSKYTIKDYIKNAGLGYDFLEDFLLINFYEKTKKWYNEKKEEECKKYNELSDDDKNDILLKERYESYFQSQRIYIKQIKEIIDISEEFYNILFDKIPELKDILNNKITEHNKYNPKNIIDKKY